MSDVINGCSSFTKSRMLISFGEFEKTNTVYSMPEMDGII
jgi:hypothetical protein